MTNIDMTAPTVAPKVGGVYRDREGVEHGPMLANYSGEHYKFRDGRGNNWTARGSVWISDRLRGGGDLIAIISEPSAEPEAGVVVKAEAFCIKAPETETMKASTYVVRVDDDGDITLRDPEAAATVQMSPGAARAIAKAILRMTGEDA